MSRRAILALVTVLAAASGAVGACTSFDSEPVDPTTDGGGTLDGPPIDPPAEAGSATDAATVLEAGHEGGLLPGMVVVAGVAKPYLIDATEVRHDDYATFLATSPPFASDKRCAWKTAVTEPIPSTAGDLPVVGVDWCDALFYCKSVGKRLCGAIGGGSVPNVQVANAAVSQWLFACAGSPGTARYAYGTAHLPGVCNDSAGALERVGSRPMCVGAANPALFDMSGNVAEWEDSCIENDAGPRTISCTIRSGGYAGPKEESRCDFHDERQRQDTYDDVGFRCCKDL